MKPVFGYLVLLTLIGSTQAIYFSSLDAAVKGLPELSMLASQFDTVAPSLAAQLRAPTFVGTLFAPTNATLSPLAKYQALLPASMMLDVFSMAVIPGPPVKLSDLVNGAVLTTLNNKTVTVKITQAVDGSGPIYYINGARVSAGNVYAGNSIVHETFGLIVPPANQLLLNTLLKDVTNPTTTKDLSPEGPPQPSPSPAAVPSPSPAVIASPSPPPAVVASPSPSPAVASPSPAAARSPSPSPTPTASPSPPAAASPATAASPSPAPATASPSPSPAASPRPASSGAVTASPSPSPAAVVLPSPSPAVVASPSPSPAVASPSPAAARSPSPSPAPTASPSPAPATSSPAPSTADSDSGEVIQIPQPLPTASPAPSTSTSTGNSAIVTESGAKTNTSVIPSTTDNTKLPGTVYSAASQTVVGAVVLFMLAIVGMLLLL